VATALDRIKTLAILPCIVEGEKPTSNAHTLRSCPRPIAAARSARAAAGVRWPGPDRVSATRSSPIWRIRWVRAVCRPLATILPELITEKQPRADLDLPALLRRFSDPRLSIGSPEDAGPEAHSEKSQRAVAPLNGPVPPALFEPPSLPEHLDESVRRMAIRRAVKGFAEEMPWHVPEAHAQHFLRAVQGLAAAIMLASGPWTQYEDMRFDILEEWLRDTGFVEGPLHGNPSEGHEVLFRGKGNKAASGELFDRPVELGEDPRAFEVLQRKARPITEVLRKALYPNLTQVPEVERCCASGALDPIRLDRAAFSEAIYKRFRIRERVDRRGRPVLLIACDGSGSLNRRQMEMLKTLSWGWIESTMKSDIQVLAGLYHSGNIRLGLAGSLVQWIYHPRKTPAFNRQDALRALLTLPNTGTGVQADALSLQFMLSEAQALARDHRIYLILLSDCAWNRSFPELGKSGFEEVCDFFEAAYNALGDRLHTTLVALGVTGETGFENFLDRVIVVADDALTDPGAVAADIGLYVASVMGERRRLLSGR